MQLIKEIEATPNQTGVLNCKWYNWLLNFISQQYDPGNFWTPKYMQIHI